MKKQLTLMFFATVILLGIIEFIYGHGTFAPQQMKNVVNFSPANPKFPTIESYTPLAQSGKPALKRGPSVTGSGTVEKIPAKEKVDKPIPPAPSTPGTPSTGCVENENEQSS